MKQFIYLFIGIFSTLITTSELYAEKLEVPNDNPYKGNWNTTEKIGTREYFYRLCIDFYEESIENDFGKKTHGYLFTGKTNPDQMVNYAISRVIQINDKEARFEYINECDDSKHIGVLIYDSKTQSITFKEVSQMKKTETPCHIGGPSVLVFYVTPNIPAPSKTVLSDKIFNIIDDENLEIIETQEEKTSHNVIETPPSFPGGEAAMMRYIASKLRYPIFALENNIQGKVVVKFCVGHDGTLSEFTVQTGAHPLLDKEAIRIVKTFPKCKPGTLNGKPVKVYFTIPIHFKLN